MPPTYKATESTTENQAERRDFVTLGLPDVPPKGDLASMEHPLFALRAGDKRVRNYERNGYTVTVKPGPDGCATIHDKDLWLYCASQLVEAKNRGAEISRTVRFTMHDFLKTTYRDTSGQAYKRAGEMLARLTGTRVETNIETGGRRIREFWGLVESAKIIESPDDGRMASMEVTLPEWLFGAINSGEILTLACSYYRVRKPIDRRIYELARKHCGRQPSWRVSLAVLYQKSGSTDALRNFRAAIRSLAESGALPDFLVAFDNNRDMVTFCPNSSNSLSV
ncbi:replication initiator protein A [Amphibiibacter pelophylacis]|uniref:Replication initiator protein A n=1 Tax=Amphibiibacter pelophylacis TaxID=1799477 RepID=A0ACC6P5B2_9BURK